MLRYAIYCRVSTDEQARQGHVSLETQRQELHRYVQTQDGIVVIDEEDIQSSTGDRGAQRPGYQRMLAAARRREVDVAVVYDYSRWGRNAGDLISSFDELARLGVRCLSILEPGEDPFMQGIHALRHEQFARDLSRKTRDALRRRAQKGEWSGHPPVGYIVHRSHERSVLTPDVIKAPLVRQLFMEAATGRYSLATLADRARDAGLRGPSGHPLSRQYVSRLLHNETYTGAVVYGQTRDGKFARGRNAPEDVIRAPGAHPALVDEMTFAQVREVLARHRRVASAPRKTRVLLSGLAYCGRCFGVPGPDGEPRAWKIYGHGTKSRSYQCSRSSMYGLCPSRTYGAVGIDNYVREVIARLFTFTTDILERASSFLQAEAEGRQRSDHDQRQEFERQLARHRRRRVDAFQAFLDGDVPKSVYHDADLEEEAAIRALERTLLSLPRATKPVDIRPVTSMLSSVTWEDLEFEDWREIATVLIERVVIRDRDDMDITWQPGADLLRRALEAGIGSTT